MKPKNTKSSIAQRRRGLGGARAQIVVGVLFGVPFGIAAFYSFAGHWPVITRIGCLLGFMFCGVQGVLAGILELRRGKKLSAEA
jgi:hypothetical protein